MAETVIPSVRGRRRLVVHLALTAGALASAALAGFVIGILGQGLASGLSVFDTSVSRTIVGLALALDVIHLSLGGLAPPSVGKQVPREWGRLFPLPLAGLLYGARLGVGPLTILSTWMWWATLVVASLIGVWMTVAVSVWFALIRIMVNAAASSLVGSMTESSLTQTLIRGKQRSWGALTSFGVALVAMVTLVGCGVTDAAARPSISPSATDTPATEIPPTTIATADSTPLTTSPAQLEDFVRTSPIQPAPVEPLAEFPVEPGESPTVPTSAIDDTSEHRLATLLPDELAGMTVESAVDRFLTIDDAAAIQPDPTEEIALLETRGYRGGWIRAFRSPTADVAVSAVYEFRDETEAEFYLEDGLITIGGYGGQFFDLPELPDVRGFQQDSTIDGETVRTMGGAFFNDDRWHLLYLVGDPTTVTPDALIPALQTFYSSAVDGDTVVPVGLDNS